MLDLKKIQITNEDIMKYINGTLLFLKFDDDSKYRKFLSGYDIEKAMIFWIEANYKIKKSENLFNINNDLKQYETIKENLILIQVILNHYPNLFFKEIKLNDNNSRIFNHQCNDDLEPVNGPDGNEYISTIKSLSSVLLNEIAINNDIIAIAGYCEDCETVFYTLI